MTYNELKSRLQEVETALNRAQGLGALAGQQLQQREQQLAPQAALAQYQANINPMAFGLPTTVRQTQTNPNRLGMAAGGAMSGYAMGNMFGMGPQGAAIGAGFGLLGGLL